MSERAFNSPAGKVMDEAIELDIEGRSPYPNRAAFIDAGTPYVDQEIRYAFEEGRAAVLVAADGTTQVLHPEPAPTLNQAKPASR
jgi:hypothetical protein